MNKWEYGRHCFLNINVYDEKLYYFYEVYTNLLKPTIDFLFALIVFLVLFPVFILVALVLTFSMKESPFFFQMRPGKNEKLFKIIKFKTMNDRRDANGLLLPDADRLTDFGKLVRKTSLDEIPQLLNVIKGDMSIVGPRPLLTQYLPLYNEFQQRRHEVKPGITGWAQVNGRNAISWEEKFDLDVYYVQNVTFVLDLKILFKTIRKVFLRADINNQDNDIMKPFKGSEKI
jgi:undecaprenyl phosphate N,N'-diacetylbacillosamine 1-phosphate transferase